MSGNLECLGIRKNREEGEEGGGKGSGHFLENEDPTLGGVGNNSFHLRRNIGVDQLPFAQAQLSTAYTLHTHHTRTQHKSAHFHTTPHNSTYLHIPPHSSA